QLSVDGGTRGTSGRDQMLRTIYRRSCKAMSGRSQPRLRRRLLHASLCSISIRRSASVIASVTSALHLSHFRMLLSMELFTYSGHARHAFDTTQLDGPGPSMLDPLVVLL